MGLLQTTSTIAKPKSTSITPISSLEEYPIPIYQFSIEIDHVIVALFQSVSGLSVTRATENLTEGGLNNFGREFPGQLSYAHITFGVGFSSSDFFYKWMMDGQYIGRPTGKSFTLIQRRPNPKGTKPIFAEVKRWNFFKAFPVNWKISELSIKDSQNIVIENLELSFEHFELAPA